MDTQKNRLLLDYHDNEDLKAVLGGLEPSKRVTIEITLQVVSNDADTFAGDIEEISLDSEEEDAGEEKSAEVDASSPVMVVMMKRKGGDASAEEDDEKEDEADGGKDEAEEDAAKKT